ncbi:MAG: beta-glucosidase, partial [Solirubrobacteraceae bacterium]|nr:beta-glucosidase [Solirubrobacteraceae bacterium]
FPKRQGDTAVQPGPQYMPSGPIVSVEGAKADYSEGVFTGYRHYDKAGIAPQFAFGYGLSYTTFALRRLSVRRTGPRAKVTFTVINTGARAGSDTPQLYIGAPKHNPLDEPVKQLRGFAKIRLAPGARRRVTLTVGVRAISYWDTRRQAWARQRGCHPVLIGESATDIRLKGPTVGPVGARCTAAIGAAG